jgi:hypothetical protein
MGGILILSLALFSCHTPSPLQRAILEPRPNEPLLQSAHFSIFRLPNGYDGKAILKETEETASTLLKWLNETNDWEKVAVLVYNPTEPDGKKLLTKPTDVRSGVKGLFFFPPQNTLLLVGAPENPRFWTVLRHEATHATIIHASPHSLPFWLNEGMATLFEGGIDEQGEPRIVPERLRMAKKLASRRKGLCLKSILTKKNPDYRDGKSYAKAWSVLYFLYQTDPQKMAFLITSKEPLIPFPFAFFGLNSIEELEESVTHILEELPDPN